MKTQMQYYAKILLSLAFVAMVMYAVNATHIGSPTILIFAAAVGAYMALNIGANDVANNVGTAYGAGALTMAGAIMIAIIFTSAGALIAGGGVVETIKKGIIDPSKITDVKVFVWIMLAALLSAAIWLNVSTAMGAPVSTTHSIVGGVMGAGIAAAGWDIVEWPQMARIAASWIISPVLGGVIAAGFLMFIKTRIIFEDDMIGSAKKNVPILVAVMTLAFVTFIVLVGFGKIWTPICSVLTFLPTATKPSFLIALSFGAIIAVIVYVLMVPYVAKRALVLGNRRDSINSLFKVPLIFAAALLSFAHGTNDVANAVGPLAAINEVLTASSLENRVAIPLWIMIIGALGLSVGLTLYGPKLIKTVGNEITELDSMRAFSVGMAAAVTVILASVLGLPVSSTHIAVGAIFGVGLLREWMISRKIEDTHTSRLAIYKNADEDVLDFISRFENSSMMDQERILCSIKRGKCIMQGDDNHELTDEEHAHLKKLFKRVLVKRNAVKKIFTAWIITVPAAAALSAFFFFAIRGFLIV